MGLGGGGGGRGGGETTAITVKLITRRGGNINQNYRDIVGEINY